MDSKKLPCNKENMRKWITALRSGEYQQGFGRLWDRNTGFCCLGVACDVLLGRQAWECEVEPNHIVLPAKVRDMLGLPTADPNILDEGATRRNDCHRWTFAQIADGLEATYDVDRRHGLTAQCAQKAEK